MDKTTTDKILGKLKELIEEAKSLKSDVKSHEDLRVKMWKIGVEKLLERIGGQKAVHEFRCAISFSFNMVDDDAKRLEYKLKQLEVGKGYLVVIKEDLELFDDSDEKELKKIKHKFEAGLNVGVIKGKYTQERE